MHGVWYGDDLSSIYLIYPVLIYLLPRFRSFPFPPSPHSLNSVRHACVWRRKSDLPQHCSASRCAIVVARGPLPCRLYPAPGKCFTSMAQVGVASWSRRRSLCCLAARCFSASEPCFVRAPQQHHPPSCHLPPSKLHGSCKGPHHSHLIRWISLELNCLERRCQLST